MVLLFTQTSKKLNTKKYFYKIAITFIANFFHTFLSQKVMIGRKTIQEKC